ncbi:MAG: DUF4190 domain-containing protein [Wenzhouxiangellaceae bacterium]|nr:DUF4190 domain-containing protein [Wenzhouxiangellaceae bacterium]
MNSRSMGRNLGQTSHRAETSTAAVVSLVFGVLAWVALPLVGSLVAVVAGHGALRDIEAAGGRVGGRGLALAGVLLGWIQLGLLLAALLFWAVISLVIGAFSLFGLIFLAGLALVFVIGLAGLFSMLFAGAG